MTVGLKNLEVKNKKNTPTKQFTVFIFKKCLPHKEHRWITHTHTHTHTHTCRHRTCRDPPHAHEGTPRNTRLTKIVDPRWRSRRTRRENLGVKNILPGGRRERKVIVITILIAFVYIALFSALDQTRCAHVTVYSPYRDTVLSLAGDKYH